MLTQAERERAAIAADQKVRDKDFLQKLDRIIELLVDIRDGTKTAPAQSVVPAKLF